MVDAFFVSVRRDTVAEEVVLVVLGITESGQREFLDFEVAPAESAQGWYALFQRLYRRGLREVLLVVSNGLTGLEEGADLQGSAPTVQGDRWPLADGRRLSANGTCPLGRTQSTRLPGRSGRLAPYVCSVLSIPTQKS